MRTILLVTFLLTIISNKATSQNPWLPMSFEITSGGPRTFYWDSTSNLFYVGGDMYEVNGKKISRLFRFDSLNRVDYMDTINPNMDGPLTIIKYLDTIYHAGISGMKTYQNGTWISKFNDPRKLDPVIQCSQLYNGKLLLGGSFKGVTDTGLDGFVIEYDGNNFSAFEDIRTQLGGQLGLNTVSISDMVEYKGKLYISGSFGHDSSDIYHHIISWDGTNWDDVKGGIFPHSNWIGVGDLAIYRDELYVGGLFHKDMGSVTNNILKWDGSQWHALGNGVYGHQIYEMKVFHDELWVFGTIDSVDNVGLGGVAIWNGDYWCNPGGEVDLEIFAVEEYRDTLYIGGNFRHIDFDSTLKKMAKYNEASPRKCGSSIDVIPLSIKEQEQETELMIYPNPAKDYLFIQGLGKSLYNLSIYDISLKLHIQQKEVDEYQHIDISSLNSGIYLLEILTARGKVVLKFIKE